MSFEDDLNTPIELPSDDIEVVLNGHLHVFRFTALDGLTWANECDKAPVRPDVTLDSAFGYDLRQLTLNVAPLCGARLVDGEPVKLRVDPPNPRSLAPEVNEWRDLFSKIDGQTFRRIGDAIWGLNELLPMEAVKAAKKAQAASRPSSDSPAKLVSPRAASTGGNRKSTPSTNTTAPVE